MCVQSMTLNAMRHTPMNLRIARLVTDTGNGKAGLALTCQRGRDSIVTRPNVTLIPSIGIHQPFSKRNSWSPSQ